MKESYATMPVDYHPADSRSLWSRHGVNTSNALYGAFYSDSPDGADVPGQGDSVNWYTTNAEYGSFQRHKPIIEAEMRKEAGLGGTQSASKTVSRGSQQNHCSQQRGDKMMADSNNNQPTGESRDGLHLPPIDRKYMVASRPCKAATIPQIETGRTARLTLQTGAGKRFIRSQCPRLWNNLQHVGLNAYPVTSQDESRDSHVLTLKRDDIIDVMEKANNPREGDQSANSSRCATPAK